MISLLLWAAALLAPPVIVRVIFEIREELAWRRFEAERKVPRG